MTERGSESTRWLLVTGVAPGEVLQNLGMSVPAHYR